MSISGFIDLNGFSIYSNSSLSRTPFNLHSSPGLGSCFNREKEDIAIRIVMGVAVQLLCGYVTLPLYALVTQMGSSMRRAVFSERVAQGLKNWHKKAKQSLSQNNSITSRHSLSLHSKTSENSLRGSVESIHTPENEEHLHSHVEDEEEISSHSTSEIKPVVGENLRIITRESYDGEISFGSSWKKNMGSSRGIGEISSIAEEDGIDRLPELIP